jgi:hypothetical protein
MKTLTLFKPRYWHSWVGLLLSLALFPILRSEHLPLKFDWITLGVAYWFILSAQSIFAAVLFCLIGMPRKEVLEPLLGRYPKDPLRIVPLLLLLPGLFYLLRRGAWSSSGALAALAAAATWALMAWPWLATFGLVLLAVRVPVHTLLHSAAFLGHPVLYQPAPALGSCRLLWARY